MVPLLAPKDAAAVAKTRQDATTLAGYVQPMPQINVTKKVVLHTDVLTRWGGVLNGDKMVIVNIYEIKPMTNWMGNP